MAVEFQLETLTPSAHILSPISIFPNRPDIEYIGKSKMIGKVMIQLLSLCIVVGASASDNLRGVSSNAALEQLLLEVMTDLDTLKTKVEKQDTLIRDIQDQLQVYEHMSRRLIDDSDCLPRYNETTMNNETIGRCIFDLPVVFEEDAKFKDDVDFLDDAFFDSDVRFGNSGDDSGHRVDFGFKAYFDNNVEFDDDVEFNDDTRFFDDVFVEGPDDSEDDPTEFEISGHVEVLFEQDETLVVDTETLLRKDVRIALSEDNDRRTKRRNLKSSSSSEDPPNVYIEGDTEIDGETTLNGGLTVVGPAGLEELTVQDTTTLNDLTAADGTFTGDVTAKENLSVFGFLGVKDASAGGSILDCDDAVVAAANLAICGPINAA
jgi:hypothetical protein